MNVPPIPDYISPIVGYRVWDWDATGLRSLNGEQWFPGRALTAKCPTTDHESPADGCSCGVYAAKNNQHLQKISFYWADYVVHGEVYLWGKVAEHDLGYRAQFAYPKSLVLPSNIDPRLEPFHLEPLMVYGADISLPTNILLWTKGSGYTPAGSDWLIGRGKPCGTWCKQWHERTLQMGDCVTVLGRGIGLAEGDDGASGCTNDSVCIRLENNDLFIVPHQGVVWNCQNWRWEADLSGYRGAVILPQSKGWKVLCRPLEEKNSDKTPLLPNPVRYRISTPPKSREELSTLRPGLHRSSSPGICGVCSSSDGYFDNWRDINVCSKCGAHEIW
jgi:hypothetical protein